ncbi:hypothetical protein NL676_005306 [Syzygium grande]|nr:hypothetical protein NL676_005306 [Syzygium grande]
MPKNSSKSEDSIPERNVENTPHSDSRLDSMLEDPIGVRPSQESIELIQPIQRDLAQVKPNQGQPNLGQPI